MLIEKIEAIGECHGVCEELKAWQRSNLQAVRRAIAEAAGLEEVPAKRGEPFNPRLHEPQYRRQNTERTDSSGRLLIEQVLRPGYRVGPESSEPLRKALVAVVR